MSDDDRDRWDRQAFGRQPSADQLLNRHLNRIGAQRAVDGDAASHLQVSMLRHFLRVMHSALDDEHIDPDVTRRVIERVIYGGSPQPTEVELRLKTQQAFRDYAAGDTRPTRINVDPESLRTLRRPEGT
jgi:hypothetical protein